jgi:hypothetical protein
MTRSNTETAANFLAEWFPSDPHGRALAAVVLAAKLDEAEKRGHERALDDERAKIALSARQGIADRVTKGLIVHSWDLEALLALERRVGVERPPAPMNLGDFVRGAVAMLALMGILAFAGVANSRRTPPATPTTEESSTK